MIRTLVTAPASNLVATNDAKDHLRVTDPSEDGLIDTLCAAATEKVEHCTNRCFVTRTYRLDLDCFTRSIFLPSVPLNSVTSVEYYDADNAQQTVDSGNYRLSLPDAMLHFDQDYSFPSIYDRHDAVQITYVSGYDAEEIPAAAVAACKLVIADLFENREGQAVGVSIMDNPTVGRLLATLKVHRV